MKALNAISSLQETQRIEEQPNHHHKEATRQTWRQITLRPLACPLQQVDDIRRECATQKRSKDQRN
jgi:hypothetical protein